MKYVYSTLCYILLTSLLFGACQGSKSRSPEGSGETTTGDLSTQNYDLSEYAIIGKKEGQAKNVFHFYKNHMGTVFRLQLIGYDQETATAVARVALAEVERIEHLVSSWRPQSEIGRLNQGAGQSSTSLSLESAWLLCQSKQITHFSGGVFDVTWATLKGLWDFKKQVIPERAELKKKLQHVGSHHIVLKRDGADPCPQLLHRTLPPSWTRFEPSPPIEWEQRVEASIDQVEVQIDLGGIAKGYAVDQVARVLKRFGYTDFLIDGGGDLLVEGRSLNNEPWSAAITHPRRQSRTWGSLWIPTGWSVVTSGDYERFFISDEVRYHHIIDLRTGYPARDSVSVTVIARGAMRADAYATALFILGPREGIALAESLPELEALVFDSLGEVHATRGAYLFSPQLKNRWRE